MSCDDCPEGIMLPPDYDPTDEQFGEFFRNDFVELLTPKVLTMVVEIEVAVPLETGQAILDSARQVGIESAREEAQGYIDDLSTVADFFVSEVKAAERVLDIDGYDVKTDIRIEESAHHSAQSANDPDGPVDGQETLEDFVAKATFHPE